MNCQVIQDLLILYSDGCCSDESKQLVEEHLKTCPECQKALDELNALSAPDTAAAKLPQAPLKKVSELKASVIQSVLMFLTFAVLVVGVTLESYTPSGARNGIWAFSLIIPATGLFLSLPNWYFVRFYRSKKAFSNISMLMTLLFCIVGYLWGVIHYSVFTAELSPAFPIAIGAGVLFCAVCCVLSKLLSNRYAQLLGKE